TLARDFRSASTSSGKPATWSRSSTESKPPSRSRWASRRVAWVTERFCERSCSKVTELRLIVSPAGDGPVGAEPATDAEASVGGVGALKDGDGIAGPGAAAGSGTEEPIAKGCGAGAGAGEPGPDDDAGIEPKPGGVVSSRSADSGGVGAVWKPGGVISGALSGAAGGVGAPEGAGGEVGDATGGGGVGGSMAG